MAPLSDETQIESAATHLNNAVDSEETNVEIDPLIPQPIGMGTSQVQSQTSPLKESKTTNEWDRKEIEQALSTSSLEEESTQVWRKQKTLPKASKENADHLLVGEEQEQKVNTQSHLNDDTPQIAVSQLETTLEWKKTNHSIMATSNVELDEEVPPLLASAQLTSSKHRSIQFKQRSKIELQPHQLSFTTPVVGWNQVSLSLLLLYTIVMYILWASFGTFAQAFANMQTLMLFSLVYLVSGYLSLRKERVVMNKAKVTKLLLFPGGLKIKKDIGFDDLQEIKLEKKQSKLLFVQLGEKRQVVFIGKDKTFYFGSHLQEEELHHLYEILQAKSVNLQQDVYL